MYIFRLILLTSLLVIAKPSFAWNEFGHMLIAELALQKLEPKLQRKIESEAFSLVRQQNSDKRLYLMRAYPGTSAFAHLSVFADDHRNTELDDLYARFAQKLPTAFIELANENTAKWHYKNQPYFSSARQKPPMPVSPLFGLEPGQEQETAIQCDLSESVDVVWAVEQLKVAFDEAENEQDKILALALLVHFVGDAHQPLHGISRVDEDCESDRGGNRFCVSYRNNSYSCETNLHAYWDSALGFFESYDRVSDAAQFVARVEVDAKQVKNLDPNEWLTEGYRQARFIYAIKDGSGGDSYYIKDGQIIAYERIALAAARLAEILQELY